MRDYTLKQRAPTLQKTTNNAEIKIEIVGRHLTKRARTIEGKL